MNSLTIQVVRPPQLGWHGTV